MTLKMIDQASYQGRAWTAAALKAAGIAVVAVKATEGTSYTNPDYLWQIGQARAAGCVVMHYHLARYGDSQAEAAWFHAHADVRPGELVALDNEAGYITAFPPAVSAAWVWAWTKQTKALTGTRAVVQYTSAYPASGGYLASVAGREPLWLAWPGADPARPPAAPLGWLLSFLQYGTRNQPVPTDADSAYFGTVQQLRTLGVPAQPPKSAQPVKYVSPGTLSLREVAGKYLSTVQAVLIATVAARLAEKAKGDHPQWILGGQEYAYLGAGNWDAILPAGSVWWVP